MANFINKDDCDDEFMWIDTDSTKEDPLRIALHNLDHSMRCPICSGLLNSDAIPVSISPCHHNFCSVCIRNSLRISVNTTTRRQALCPVCRCIIGDYNKGSKQDSVYRPNKAIEDAANNFEKLRHQLLRKLDGDADADAVQGCHYDIKKKNQQQQRHSVPVVRASKRIKTTSASSHTSTSVSTSDISSTEPKHQQPKRSQLPHTHYQSLKHKQLVALLNKYNIPAQGSTQQLRDRHLAFVTLHNADCDATNPRSCKQLVAEIMRKENQVRDEARKDKVNGADRQNDCMKKWKNKERSAATTGAVQSGNKFFDERCKDGFGALIREAKMRKQKMRVDDDLKKTKQGTSSDGEKKRQEEDRGEARTDDAVANASDDSNDSQATASYDRNADQDDEEDDDGGVYQVVYKKDAKLAAIDEREEDAKPTAKRRHDDNMDHGSNQDIIKIDDDNQQSFAPYDTAASHQNKNNHADDSAPKSSFDEEYANFKSAMSASKQSNKQQSPSICGPWACSTCTYWNENRKWTNATCEMCNSKRPRVNSKFNGSDIPPTFLTID